MADRSRSCISTSVFKSSTGCIKLMLRISCIILSFFTLISTCVILGELDFPSLEDRYAGFTFSEPITVFSERVESTRQSTWATGICLAIISFIAVILEITLLVVSFFSFAVNSPTFLLIVDIISGAVCSLLFFAVSIPMDIYYGKWTDISGIIEYIFQTNLILDLNSFVDGASGAKGLFNLDQLIPATGATAVFGYLSTFAFVVLVLASIIMIFTSSRQSTSSSTTSKPV